MYIELTVNKADALSHIEGRQQKTFLPPSDGFVGGLCKGIFSRNCFWGHRSHRSASAYSSFFPILYGKVVERSDDAAIEGVYRLSTFVIGLVSLFHAMVLAFIYALVRHGQSSLLGKLGGVSFLLLFLVTLWTMIVCGEKMSRAEIDEIDGYFHDIVSDVRKPEEPQQGTAPVGPENE
jgi:hypothetical protein